MKAAACYLALGLALAPAGSALAQSDAPAKACGLPSIQYLGTLDARLATRAIEAINLAAARQGFTENPKLEALISPHTEVSLGAGDVGRPLGYGAYGLRRMVRLMKADRYQYLNWGGMPYPIDNPCAERAIKIEFIDTAKGPIYPVAFTFMNGIMTSAKGWSQSFTSGPVAKIED